MTSDAGATAHITTKVPRFAVGPAAAALVVVDVATLGFITLGFEMVASRILTPLFGSGIYTWATIISIVVAGLMAGYFVGGFVADRYHSFMVAASVISIRSVALSSCTAGSSALYTSSSSCTLAGSKIRSARIIS